jgi:hypothetical protein
VCARKSASNKPSTCPSRVPAAAATPRTYLSAWQLICPQPIQPPASVCSPYWRGVGACAVIARRAWPEPDSHASMERDRRRVRLEDHSRRAALCPLHRRAIGCRPDSRRVDPRGARPLAADRMDTMVLHRVQRTGGHLPALLDRRDVWSRADVDRPRPRPLVRCPRRGDRQH